MKFTRIRDPKKTNLRQDIINFCVRYNTIIEFMEGNKLTCIFLMTVEKNAIRISVPVSVFRSITKKVRYGSI